MVSSFGLDLSVQDYPSKAHPIEGLIPYMRFRSRMVGQTAASWVLTELCAVSGNTTQLLSLERMLRVALASWLLQFP